MRAWKEGGSRWKSWSLRLVSAALKVGNGPRDRLHILSCCASTFAVSREDYMLPRCQQCHRLSAVGRQCSCWVLGYG